MRALHQNPLGSGRAGRKEVLLRPLVHRHQRLGHAPTERRQRVLDAKRDFAAHVPGDEAVVLERAQRLGQRLLGDLADLVEDLAVPPGPGREQVEDVHAPLAGEQPEHRAGAVDHLEVVGLRCERVHGHAHRACRPRARGQHAAAIARYRGGSADRRCTSAHRTSRLSASRAVRQARSTCGSRCSTR